MSKQEVPVSSTMRQPNYANDEIDLREVIATLWQGKWIILVFTAVFAVAGVVYALSKPNIYQASVLLAPAQDENISGGVSGQLGGLASLAGISLGQDGSNKTIIAKQILQSRAFLTDFIHRHDLSVPLMATDGWDEELKSWRIDQKVFNPETNEWLLGDDGKSLKPSDWDLVKQFKESHLSLSEDKETGMVNLRVKSQSPLAARDWARMLVNEINEHMRAQDVSEAEARISYLDKKLSETNIAGMQQVFYQLIESETRTIMLANAKNEYIFKTIDPAVVPQEKSEPKRSLLVVSAIMIGFLAGVIMILIKSTFRKYREESRIEHK